MQKDLPTYTILAGSNGAGKSTFRDVMDIKGTVIDPDAIARTLDKDLPEAQKNMQAGRIAINTMKDYFKDKVSFIQETTLSSDLKSNIELAKLQDYKINLIYIAVSDPQIAIKNIESRVARGLHHIPDETVNRRFPVTFNNLVKLSNRIDNITILDNTNKNYHPILSVEHRDVVYKCKDIPKWLEQTVYKVVENVNKPRDKETLSVTKKELNKLMQNEKEFKFKVNPFQDINSSKFTIFANGENMKAIEKILDHFRDIGRDR